MPKLSARALLETLRCIALSSSTAYLSACTPLNDLDDYSRAWGAPEAPGTDGDLDADAREPPDTGQGEGEAPGAVPLQSPDASDSGMQATTSGDGGRDGAPEPTPEAGSGLDSGLACAGGELLGPDGHCYFFEPGALNWSAARAACQGRGPGWDLTSIRSPAESEFIGAELEFDAWIGASDAAVETTWVWVNDDVAFWSGDAETGAAVDGAYVNWNPTEPNGGVATNCARALSAAPTAPWADLGCEQELGSVCEHYP